MENLVLVGFSCSGKTTVGRTLARRLRLRFIDTDKVVEELTGRSIPDIFAADGEAAFRALERDVVAQVCQERFQIISTGGGAFMEPRSRDLLRYGNLVIHLRVRPETVVERLTNSKRGRPRPLLEAPDPLKRVTELMAARQQYYALAHVGLDVDERPTHLLASDIIRQWFAWRRARRASRPALPQARKPAQAPG